MAKGQVAKQQIAQEILKYFGEKAFVYDKDIRINWVEDGQPCQIKITLTAAKVAVEKDGDVALPAAAPIPKAEMVDFEASTPAPVAAPAEPSAQEKKNIQDLLAKLGL